MSSEDEPMHDVPGNFPPYDDDHPWLNFENVSRLSRKKKDTYGTRLNKNLQFSVYARKIVDWGVLANIRMHGNFEAGSDQMIAMTTMVYQGFRSVAWSWLFQIYEPIYVEPTYEFYSSFEFNNVEPDIRKKTIHFVLGGVKRDVSIVEFDVAMGLYNDGETHHPNFVGHLRNSIKEYNFSELSDIWTYGRKLRRDTMGQVSGLVILVFETLV